MAKTKEQKQEDERLLIQAQDMQGIGRAIQEGFKQSQSDLNDMLSDMGLSDDESAGVRQLIHRLQTQPQARRLLDALIESNENYADEGTKKVRRRIERREKSGKNKKK